MEEHRHVSISDYKLLHAVEVNTS